MPRPHRPNPYSGAPTPTPAPSELHEHCVRMAMEAYDASWDSWVDTGSNPGLRKRFLAAVRERIAQSAQIAACNLATNKDAAELLSAAEWLDGVKDGWSFAAATKSVRWGTFPGPRNGATGTTSSLAHAILAAARSLGWPGGGK